MLQHEAKTVQATYEDGTTGERTLQFPIKAVEKCYIIGTASTKDLVPWDDKEAEFWGVNNLFGAGLKGEHYDRWFEIHNLWQDPVTKKMQRRGSDNFRGQPVLDYMQAIAKLNCTVYMQKHWPDCHPYAIQYPLQKIVAFFQEKVGLSLDLCRYLTNTITYEIVLAIYLGFKEIHIYGVDMQAGSEYGGQRPSCEFWLGVAAGMGIKVHIPKQADLLKTRFVYGFEERQQDEFRDKLEKARVDLKVKRREMEARQVQDAQAIQQCLGGEQVLSEVQRIWTNLGDDLLLQKRGS